MKPVPIQQAGAIASAIGNSGSVALHLETASPEGSAADDPWRGEIRAMVLAVPEHAPWFIDLKTWGMIPAELAAAIEAAELVAHGARNVLLWLGVKHGLRPQKVFCTRTAAWLLSVGTPDSLDLDATLSRHLRIPPEGDRPQSDWGGLFVTEDQIHSAVNQVDLLHELRRVLKRAISSASLQTVCELEMDLIPVVAAMEEAGVAVDARVLESQRAEAGRSMQEAARHLAALLKTPTLNPSSPTQLAKALARANLSVHGTEEFHLKAVDEGLIIPAIFDYRAKEKVLQQVESLLAGVRADGRIHARLEPAGTESGQISSHLPNLQASGRGSLRAAFIAPTGRALIAADYSRIALRIVADIAGEEEIIAAFQRGDDLHVHTAAAILDKPAAEVGPEDRRIAKSANFGLLFGQGAKGLAEFARETYGVSLSIEDALSIRTRFFSAYPALARWHASCAKIAATKVPEVRTVTGRRRLISPGANRWSRVTALIATPVQGGCADGLKQAMVELARALPSGARLVGTVDDELFVECDEGDSQEVARIARKTMVAAMQKLFPSVPIAVDVSVSQPPTDWESPSCPPVRENIPAFGEELC